MVPKPSYVHGGVVVVMALLFRNRARQARFPPRWTRQFVLSSALGAVIGARLFYLITTQDLFRRPLRELLTLQGTASWGAYLGALVGGWLWHRWSGIDALPYLDALASFAGVAHVVGRWSCWLAGDDFGRVSNVPWAITFPGGSLPYRAHLSAGLIEPAALTSLPVHPLQFYFMLAGGVVFVLCSAAWRRWRQVSGATLALFLLATGLIRLPLESFRDPAAGGAVLGLSVSQIMSIAMIVAGIAMGWPKWKGVIAQPPPLGLKRGVSLASQADPSKALPLT